MPVLGKIGSLSAKGFRPNVVGERTTWISSDFNQSPSFGGAGYSYVGFAGNGVSLSEGSSFTLFLPQTKSGIRIILQAAGGASSNNDGDGDSSANSGATTVFDIPKTTFKVNATYLIGSAGPNLSASGANYINVNPRPISIASNPFGSYAVNTGQGGFTGNAAFDAAFLVNGMLYSYAEGGGATVNYDSMNGNTSRAYVNTSYVTSVVTYNGPVSPGRGVAPTNSSYPNWNFNLYSDLATAYGRSGNVAGNRYGQGGFEAALSSAGYSGYPGFLWAIIL